MFYLGLEYHPAESGKQREPRFSCEGCLVSGEQDRFYDRIAVSGFVSKSSVQMLSDALVSSGLEHVGCKIGCLSVLGAGC
jgi:hypothetical protein